MSDCMVDFVQEGVDCVVCGGELQDFSLVVCCIGQLLMVNCVLLEYFVCFGMFKMLEDLQDYMVVNYFFVCNGCCMDWDFVIDGQK